MSFFCDGCHELIAEGAPRYRCTAGCEFDECADCFAEQRDGDEPVPLDLSRAGAAPVVAVDKAPVTVPLIYELLQRIPISLLR